MKKAWLGLSACLLLGSSLVFAAPSASRRANEKPTAPKKTKPEPETTCPGNCTLQCGFSVMFSEHPQICGCICHGGGG
jgi:hypothetical protein